MSRQRSAHPTSSWDLTNNQSDAIVEEIHAWRSQYAAQFDNDLDKIFADLKAREADNPVKRSASRPLRPRK